MKKKRKVMLIGWDAADWKIINELIKEGKMPTMLQFLQNGVYGNIATLDPPFSPMLWTSIATGVRPDKHGILGFVEPDPNQPAVRPVSTTSRKVKAIWNILNQEGYIPHVIGWWPSHPAEPINGIMISNHFQRMNDDKPGPLLKDVVHPKDLAPLFSHFRIHPNELTKEHLIPFVPNASRIDQEKDKRLHLIAKNIAECSSIHAAATWIAENREWDFLALYLDTIDHFSHGFMNYKAPKIPGVSNDDFEIYKDVVTSAYRYHDMMLEKLLTLAGEDTTVIIVSDHGFHSDHLRPGLLPDEPAGPAYQHRDYGIFCMKGPGIKKDERIYGAGLLDITPTLLSLYDLPIGQDMDGVPLIQCFEKMPEIKTIPSWEFVDGNSGMHPKEFQEDPYDAQESLKQLIELGYIEEPGEDIEENIQNVIKESRYNLARVYLGAKKFEKALPILRELYENEPHLGRFAFRLIECYKNEGDTDECVAINDRFRIEIKKKILPESELKRISEEVIPEDLPVAEKEKRKKDKAKKMANNRQIYKELVLSDLIEGEILSLQNKFKEALEIFYLIKKRSSKNPGLNLKIANAFLKMKKWKDALTSFDEVLEFDPENYAAFQGKAMVYFYMKDFEKSVDCSLDSIQLLYHNPPAHYLLAEALYMYGDYENSEKAFNVCLTMAPGIGNARNYLIDLYENKLNLPEKAEQLKGFFTDKKMYIEKLQNEPDYSFTPDINIRAPKFNIQEIEERPIIIVSGLPRSGTSLMMQILEKAGVEILTDQKRRADENNPKGYYEHEAVKRMGRDNAWMQNAPGKALKVIANLLIHLPPKYHYKIIFMNRDINEVVASQHKMLIREGKAKEGTYPLSLQTSFLRTLKKCETWAKNSYNVEIVYVDHKILIEHPELEIEKVFKFINIDSEMKSVLSVIDPNLYRIRK